MDLGWALFVSLYQRYLLPISVLPTATQRELLIQTGEQFDAAHGQRAAALYSAGGSSSSSRRSGRARDVSGDLPSF